ncbi:hypothetical protein, partial [Treponema sp.]|uniref:pectate lyase family protein n=1 Tax=Treponema sp. TaxID=166 RepID=UPI003890D948
VYFGGQATSKTVSSSSSSAALNYLVPVLYPEQGATDVFTDTQLVLTFESEPSLVSGTAVTISDSSSTVDTITVNSTTADESQSTQSGYTVNVGNQQQVRTDGNSVYIQPHYNGTTSATVLQGLTTYTVDVSDIINIPSSYDGFLFEDGTTDWSFTTKAAASAAATMTVSNATTNNSADFFSVYGALFAAASKSSGTYEIDIAATGTPYYELISVQGKGAHIILKGQGTATYGSDVVIEYVNNVYMNNSTHTRPSFYFKGSGDLTFENVTLKNLTQRTTSYTADGSYTSNGSYQAETLYYACSTGYVNAYNSSFVSLQDTILTAGDKVWFYGSYVAGDVDFMWGTSSVALFENCAIECLNTSATAAYLFETRVGSTSGTSIGKGYVLLNSTVTVDSGVTAYYARRATGKSSTTYYDQAAIVNSTFSGSGSLAASRWYIGNEPEYLSDTLYGSSADVGWKEYGVTNSTATSSTTSTSAYGTITDTEYTNEYSGRHAILNRYYDITNACYAKDSSTNWDIDTLISDRGYTVADDSSSETLSGEAVTTSVVYDFSSANPTTYTDLTCTSIGWNNSAYASGGNGSSISFAVTDACTVTVYYCYAASGTITAGSQSSTSFSTSSGSTSQIDSTVYEVTAASTVTVAYTGTTYLTKIVVTYTTANSEESTSEESSTGSEETSETTTVMWNASDYEVATITSTDSTNYGIMTLIGTSSASLAIASCTSTTIGDYTFTKQLQLGGSGSTTSRAMQFTLTDAASITVYAVSGKTSASRTLNVSNGSTVVGSGSLTTADSFTVNNLSAGTYYIYSGGSGINVYGVEIVYGSTTDGVSSVTISGSAAMIAGNSVTLTATPDVTPTDETYTWAIASGSDYVTLASTTTSSMVVTGTAAGTATITATVDGVTSSAFTVTVKASASDFINDDGSTISDSDSSARSSTLTISSSDVPTGYAGVSYSSTYGSTTYTSVTVTSRSDLVTYAKAGNYFIIVDGMIDMTDGLLPSTGGGTTTSLDSFVNTTSGGTYSDYEAWVAAYAAACSTTSDDETSGSGNTALYDDLRKLSDTYKSQIQLVVKSNTIIVGKDASSGIKGANISMSGVSNVQLRNLVIQDAYDPFPHHEVKDDGVTSDGYNAQWDCITIQGSCSYIWIDHCTIQDTMTLSHVYTGGTTEEKWQTYDGLLDIKGTGANITVSYCKFKNHDKTSLIGSSDSEGSASTRLITYHHNYFYNCGQRLPMVRNTTMHLYNNYYAYSSGTYTQQYAVGVRKGSVIYAENNYFDSGIKYAFSDSGSSSTSGTLYASGNTNNASSGTSLTNTVGDTLFSAGPAAYTYSADTAATVQSNLPSEAGAGDVTIN